MLCGRNTELLYATAERCRARGAAVDTACFDLADFRQQVASLEAADTCNPFDLVIFNAGTGGSLPSDAAAFRHSICEQGCTDDWCREIHTRHLFSGTHVLRALAGGLFLSARSPNPFLCPWHPCTLGQGPDLR